MKKIVMFGVIVSTMAGIAANLSKEEVAKRFAMRDKIILEKEGGYLVKPGTPSGKIVVINSQKSVPAQAFVEAGKSFTRKLKGLVSVIDGEAVDANTAAAAKRKANADFAIFIVDNAELPMSLIALEAQWAICNISPLREGIVGDKQLVSRAQSEYARVFGVLCGGTASQFEAALMNEVKKPSDLDGKGSELPVDVVAKFLRYLEMRGVRPERKVFYRKACLEGWAPQPTNKFQKAVWDEVHKLPTKPLVIKPETK